MPLTVLRASAGSGKTYRLAVSFLRLLLEAESAGQPLDPASILATTFTRAAAGEILDRVLRLLSGAVLSATEREALAAATGLPLEDGVCARLLARLAAHLDRLTVSTMDAFFGQIARAFAAELGLAPGWRLVADETEEEVRCVVLRAVLEETGGQPLFEALRTFRRRKAGSSMQEALARLSGTLEAIPPPDDPPELRPVAPRLWSGEEVAEVLALLDAAPEWTPRTQKGEISTRWTKPLEQLRAAVAPGAMATNLFEATLAQKIQDGVTTYYNQEIPPVLCAAMAPLLAVAREAIGQEYRARMEALSWIARYYRQARLETIFAEAAYTFADIPRLVSRYAMRSDDLLFRLGTKLRHVLFDEFQDTSAEQYAFFRPLLEEIGSNGESSILVVGDEKQAIYGWRGGDRALMRGPLEELGAQIGMAGVEPLHQSYRSSQAVLDAVNRTFGVLRGAWLPKEPVIEAAGKAWAEGFVDHAPAERVRALRGEVRLLEVEGERGEMESRLVAKAVELVRGHLEQDPGRKIGVLLRKRKLMPWLFSEIQKACPGVEVSAEGGNPLTDSRAVELVLSLLTYLDHPGHTAARAVVLSSPAREAFGLPPEANPADPADAGEHAVARGLRRLLLDHGFAETIRRWVRSPVFDAFCTEYDRQRCEQLLDVARDYDQRNGGHSGRPGRFVAHVRRRRVERRGGSTVRILSVHASKGLEFEAVILLELDARQQNADAVSVVEHEGRLCLLPSSKEAPMLGLEEQLEARQAEEFSEELCVLYVGMTRARSFLDLVLRAGSQDRIAGLLRAGLKPEPDGEGVVARVEGLSARQCEEAAGRVQPLSAASPDAGLADPSRLAGRVERMDGAVDGAGAGRSRASYTAPSDREEGGRIADLFSTPNRAAMRRGELFHAWLARIVWAEEGLPGVEELLAATRPLCRRLPPGQAEEWARRLLAQIATPASPLHRVFQRPPEAERLEVWRERRFAVVESTPRGEELLSGSFDRVVLWRDPAGGVARAEIVDFKTDRFSGAAQRQALEERYQPQLDAYRRALALLIPGLEACRIEASLCLFGEE